MDATATMAADGSVTILAVNRDTAEDMALAVDLRDFPGLTSASHTVLHHDDVNAVNTEVAPGAVSPEQRQGAKLDNGRLSVIVPALSWNVIRIQ